ncbi:hypothetical protein NTG1052_50002 [Candidatus Nitrotoga sp. 1052]|nr:hypothetical protein NTG1052_50002 [Candidatus Nitrotoga sp. 1052]
MQDNYLRFILQMVDDSLSQAQVPFDPRIEKQPVIANSAEDINRSE